MNDELRLILQKMWALKESTDPEPAHGTADDLLIEAIREIAGRQGSDTEILLIAIADVFDGLQKWYA